MEFQNRNPQFPGRVRLTPVSGQTNVYDMTLEDGAVSTRKPPYTGTFLGRNFFEGGSIRSTI